MIKNMDHAREVQDRRVAEGKKGVSKAVRRFNRKVAGNPYEGARLNMLLPADFSGCRTFNEAHGY